MSASKTSQLEMSRLQTLLAELPRLALPQEPLTQFTIFPKLPIELRREIWKHASFEPCIIKLFVYESCFRTRRVEGQSKAPALLLTSKEARSEGLRYYELCWETCPFNERHTKNSVYLNFDVDHFRHDATLCVLLGEITEYNFDAEAMKKIKFLDLDHTHIDATIPLRGCLPTYVHKWHS